MQKEKGFTLLTLLFLLALGIVVAMISFKVVPTYIDYMTVTKTLENILLEGTDKTDSDLRKTLDARLNVNFIRDLSSKDLEISKDDGMLTLVVPINRKEHLVGGVSLSIDLEAKASAPLR
jgi:hypothetical protein